MMRPMKRAFGLLFVLALFAASAAQALPDAVRQGETGARAWREWGSGEMTWLGIALYRATLWVAGDDAQTAPLALQLQYRRDIARDRLVRTSVDEMRRLGGASIHEAQLKRWEVDLRRVFPDVREGETIVGVHHPGRGASFYHRGQATGTIDDDEFARLFFAIWLDPQCRSPELRAALLNRSPG